MSTDPQHLTVRPWVRLATLALGLPTVITGLWAIMSPQGWFDNFPGFDPRLVAALPPFNEHLATDAGAGLFASGAVLVAAAWLASTQAVKIGLIGYAAFTIPHTGWHLFNPADALSGAEDVTNSLVLVLSVVAAAGLYLAAGQPSSDRGHEPADRREMEVTT